jgi:glycosyltransferase involved in cell wall biosynthesis
LDREHLREILILVSPQSNFHQVLTSADVETPRIDYLEMARTLHGQVFGDQINFRYWHRAVGSFEKKLRLDLSLALAAARYASPETVFLSTSEKIALPLGLILKRTGSGPVHIAIGHKLSSGNKTRLLTRIDLKNKINQIICVCQAQANYARGKLGFPEERVHFIPDKVDEKYFSPHLDEDEKFLLAVGQEQRDYKTLIRAIDGTGIKAIIVASSPWSSNHSSPEHMQNVGLKTRVSFHELRLLYSMARLVVVPIKPNIDYAAGVNGVLEAMAMAKALIVSKTEGICDYIEHNETGQFVTPGDIAELREAILHLWHHPDTRSRLGTNARQAVIDRMTMDHYLDNIQKIVLEPS